MSSRRTAIDELTGALSSSGGRTPRHFTIDDSGATGMPFASTPQNPPNPKFVAIGPTH